MNIVHHLDFDAPTRENANLLIEDKVFTVNRLTILLDYLWSVISWQCPVICNDKLPFSCPFIFEIIEVLFCIIVIRIGYYVLQRHKIAL